jgi:hypothetical protein
VDVTADDIAQGQRRGGSTCPIARAISRVWPYPVSVGGTCAALHDSDGLGGRSTCVDFPPVARAFIGAFDSGLSVKPFSFTIELPE